VAAIVSVLLHDLVVGDRPATICGRERNPTWIESAIRARFVRDSFHNLSTGLPTRLSRDSGPADAVPPRWATTLGSAWKMRADEEMASGALRPSAPRSKTDRPTRGRQRCPGFARAGSCRLPRRDPPNRTVMQALRLRQPRNWRSPTIARRLRAERVAMGVCGSVCRTSGKHVSSALRDARAAQSAAGTHWQEPTTPRDLICDPCGFHRRSVTQSIPS
jgi:hypothetical protein